MVAFPHTLSLQEQLDEALAAQRDECPSFYAVASVFETTLMESVLMARFLIVSCRSIPTERNGNLEPWTEAIARECTQTFLQLGNVVRMTNAYLALSAEERSNIEAKLLSSPMDC